MLLNEQTAVQLGDKKVVGVRQGDKFILGRHNLVPNGQGRYTSGTVEVRRNLANKPAGTTISVNPGELGFKDRWAGSGGAQQVTLLTGIQGPVGTGITTAVRKTLTVIGTALNDVAFGHGLSGVDAYPVTPGEVYTVSSYWRVSRSQSRMPTNRITILNVDASGTVLNIIQGVNNTGPIVADEWNRVSNTFTVPKNTNFIEILQDVYFMESGALQVGDTLDGTGLLVEKSSLLRPYFDGSYSPDPDLTPSWTGTANDSPSVLTGRVPTGLSNEGNGRRYVSHDSEGNAVLTTFRNGTGAYGVWAPIGAVTEGQWVGVSGWIYNPDGGTSTSRPFGKVWRGESPYDWLAPALITDADMRSATSGFTYVSGSVQVTSSSTLTRVLLGTFDAPIGARFMIRDMVVSVADTQEEALRLVQAPYRDGDSPGWTWDGTPGQSASRGLS